MTHTRGLDRWSRLANKLARRTLEIFSGTHRTNRIRESRFARKQLVSFLRTAREF
jgi:hypothetical protein